LRVASALVLAPVALAAVWLGSLFLALLTLLAAAAMAWEWSRLAGRGRFGPSDALIMATAVTAVALTAAGAVGPALAVALIGSALAFAASRLSRGGPPPLWAALATLWVALPSIAWLWLGGDPIWGRWTLLWLLGVVWATDILAYAAGRTIGGPRLAPRLSPRKTWAGLLGGVLGATLVGCVMARFLGAPAFSLLAAVSAVLAVIGQAGDIAESAAKRRFGVKDSSAIIPGHGGVLDRLDGMLAAVTAVAALSLMLGRSILALH
jgi:phosphatidate cytidylyltransferase